MVDSITFCSWPFPMSLTTFTCAEQQRVKTTVGHRRLHPNRTKMVVVIRRHAPGIQRSFYPVPPRASSRQSAHIPKQTDAFPQKERGVPFSDPRTAITIPWRTVPSDPSNHTHVPKPPAARTSGSIPSISSEKNGIPYFHTTQPKAAAAKAPEFRSPQKRSRPFHSEYPPPDMQNGTRWHASEGSDIPRFRGCERHCQKQDAGR